ncbi:MAG: Crp/Fnr family transcriptional regulator [Gemmataceae bacterium]|nr:Crp/Fnr family transcriptional regulator [Gemmataceae bacterium]
MNGKLWYLKQCDLFEKLTPQQAERLDRHASLLTFKRQALVYSPAEPGLSVLVLARGRIKIKDITPDGKETILAFIEEGEIFGELAVLDGQARGEFAEAMTEVQVLVIPREDLLWLLELRPDVALSITKLVGLRRRRIENRFRNVLFLSSRERMVRLLGELVEFHGERAGNACRIRLPLSHQDLASLIGVTRETVTHVLGQLQADGLVQARRRQITVLDCDRLAEEGAWAADPFRVGSPSPTLRPRTREL